MNIAILNLCMPEASLDQYGSVGTQIESWLAPHLPEAMFTVIDVATGSLLPQPEEYQGYIVSGSEKGVYDETEWMKPLKQFLRDSKAQQLPLYGICFGHQIMAECFGGSAHKADSGFVVGACEFTDGKHSFAAHSMHRDQVTKIPPGARVTASAGYCPIAALDYDFPAKSVQFHPEYRKQFVAVAIDYFEGDLLNSEEAADSRNSLATSVDVSLCATDAATFFRQCVRQSSEMDCN